MLTGNRPVATVVGMRVLAVLGFFVAFLVGCVSGADLAKERASREYDCRMSDITVKWLSSASNSHDIYRVNACGTVATYACDEVASTCVKESDDR